MNSMTDKPEIMLRVPFTDLRIDDTLNSRAKPTPSSLAGLSEDIKMNGLLMPVLARYKHDDEEEHPEPYVLVAGFSRSHSCRDILKWPDINVIVKPMTKLQAVIANAAENLNRTDLNMMEEAEPIRRLTRMGLNQEEICKALGRPRGWVQPRLYLLRMDEPIQEMAKGGFLTQDNIRELYSIANPSDRVLAAKALKERRQRAGGAKVKVLRESVATKKERCLISRHRTKEEMENLQVHLNTIKMPHGFDRKVLAWCAGFINDMELQAAIQDVMSAEGIDCYPDPLGIPNYKEKELV